MYLHDRNNLQHNTATSGPKDPVGFAWRFETGGAVRSSPAVADGTVFFGSKDGNVYALDMVSGNETWRFETGGPVVSSPAVEGATVYVGSGDQNVYALNAATGEKRWAFQTGGSVRSSPNIHTPVWAEESDPYVGAPEGVLAVGSDDGTVYTLNPATGESLLEISTQGPVVSTPALTEDVLNGELMVWIEAGSTDGSLYGTVVLAISRDNRIEQIDIGPQIHSSVVTPDGGKLFVFGADDHKLYHWPHSRGRDWQFETGGNVHSSPAISEETGTIYLGSSDQNVYAVTGGEASAGGGERQWAFETNGIVDSSPALADGVLYVGSGDKHVYAIDAETGESVWSLRTGGSVFSSPAVVNGTVFVGSDDGHVYAMAACQ